MKTTFIYFGIMAMLFSNSVIANELNHQENKTVSNTGQLKKPVIDFEFEDTITIMPSHKKTIEEIMAEDNQIIESTIIQETFPIDLNILSKGGVQL